MLTKCALHSKYKPIWKVVQVGMQAIRPYRPFTRTL